MGEFCDGKCYQVLAWTNFVMVSVISFGMEEFCYGKCQQVLVWENSVMVSVIRFWYGRIL